MALKPKKHYNGLITNHVIIITYLSAALPGLIMWPTCLIMWPTCLIMWPTCLRHCPVWSEWRSAGGTWPGPPAYRRVTWSRNCRRPYTGGRPRVYTWPRTWTGLWMRTWENMREHCIMCTWTLGWGWEHERTLYHVYMDAGLWMRTWENTVSCVHGCWAVDENMREHCIMCTWTLGCGWEHERTLYHVYMDAGLWMRTWENTVSCVHGCWAVDEDMREHCIMCTWTLGCGWEHERTLYHVYMDAGLWMRTWENTVSCVHGCWAVDEDMREHCIMCTWTLGCGWEHERTLYHVYMDAGLWMRTWENTVSCVHGCWAVDENMREHCIMCTWMLGCGWGHERTLYHVYMDAGLWMRTWENTVSCVHGCWAVDENMREHCIMCTWMLGCGWEHERTLYHVYMDAGLWMRTWENTVSCVHGCWAVDENMREHCIMWTWMLGCGWEHERTLYHVNMDAGLWMRTWENTVSCVHGCWAVDEDMREHCIMCTWMLGCGWEHERTLYHVYMDAGLWMRTWENTVSCVHGCWAVDENMREHCIMCTWMLGCGWEHERTLYHVYMDAGLWMRTWENTVSCEHGCWAVDEDMREHCIMCTWMLGCGWEHERTLYHVYMDAGLWMRTWENTVSCIHGGWAVEENMREHERTLYHVYMDAGLWMRTWENTVSCVHGCWAVDENMREHCIMCTWTLGCGWEHERTLYHVYMEAGLWRRTWENMREHCIMGTWMLGCGWEHERTWENTVSCVHGCWAVDENMREHCIMCTWMLGCGWEHERTWENTVSCVHGRWAVDENMREHCIMCTWMLGCGWGHERTWENTVSCVHGGWAVEENMREHERTLYHVYMDAGLWMRTWENMREHCIMCTWRLGCGGEHERTWENTVSCVHGGWAVEENMREHERTLYHVYMEAGLWRRTWENMREHCIMCTWMLGCGWEHERTLYHVYMDAGLWMRTWENTVSCVHGCWAVDENMREHCIMCTWTLGCGWEHERTLYHVYMDAGLWMRTWENTVSCVHGCWAVDENMREHCIMCTWMLGCGWEHERTWENTVSCVHGPWAVEENMREHCIMCTWTLGCGGEHERTLYHVYMDAGLWMRTWENTVSCVHGRWAVDENMREHCIMCTWMLGCGWGHERTLYHGYMDAGLWMRTWENTVSCVHGCWAVDENMREHCIMCTWMLGCGWEHERTLYHVYMDAGLWMRTWENTVSCVHGCWAVDENMREHCIMCTWTLGCGWGHERTWENTVSCVHGCWAVDENMREHCIMCTWMLGCGWEHERTLYHVYMDAGLWMRTWENTVTCVHGGWAVEENMREHCIMCTWMLGCGWEHERTLYHVYMDAGLWMRTWENTVSWVHGRWAVDENMREHCIMGTWMLGCGWGHERTLYHVYMDAGLWMRTWENTVSCVHGRWAVDENMREHCIMGTWTLGCGWEHERTLYHGYMDAGLWMRTWENTVSCVHGCWAVDENMREHCIMCTWTLGCGWEHERTLYHVYMDAGLWVRTWENMREHCIMCTWMLGCGWGHERTLYHGYMDAGLWMRTWENTVSWVHGCWAVDENMREHCIMCTWTLGCGWEHERTLYHVYMDAGLWVRTWENMREHCIMCTWMLGCGWGHERTLYHVYMDAGLWMRTWENTVSWVHGRWAVDENMREHCIMGTWMLGCGWEHERTWENTVSWVHGCWAVGENMREHERTLYHVYMDAGLWMRTWENMREHCIMGTWTLGCGWEHERTWENTVSWVHGCWAVGENMREHERTLYHVYMDAGLWMRTWENMREHCIMGTWMLGCGWEHERTWENTVSCVHGCWAVDEDMREHERTLYHGYMDAGLWMRTWENTVSCVHGCWAVDEDIREHCIMCTWMLGCGWGHERTLYHVYMDAGLWMRTLENTVSCVHGRWAVDENMREHCIMCTWMLGCGWGHERTLYHVYMDAGLWMRTLENTVSCVHGRWAVDENMREHCIMCTWMLGCGWGHERTLYHVYMDAGLWMRTWENTVSCVHGCWAVDENMREHCIMCTWMLGCGWGHERTLYHVYMDAGLWMRTWENTVSCVHGCWAVDENMREHCIMGTWTLGCGWEHERTLYHVYMDAGLWMRTWENTVSCVHGRWAVDENMREHCIMCTWMLGCGWEHERTLYHVYMDAGLWMRTWENTVSCVHGRWAVDENMREHCIMGTWMLGCGWGHERTLYHVYMDAGLWMRTLENTVSCVHGCWAVDENMREHCIMCTWMLGCGWGHERTLYHVYMDAGLWMRTWENTVSCVHGCWAVDENMREHCIMYTWRLGCGGEHERTWENTVSCVHGRWAVDENMREHCIMCTWTLGCGWEHERTLYHVYMDAGLWVRTWENTVSCVHGCWAVDEDMREHCIMCTWMLGCGWEHERTLYHVYMDAGLWMRTWENTVSWVHGCWAVDENMREHERTLYHVYMDAGLWMRTWENTVSCVHGRWAVDENMREHCIMCTWTLVCGWEHERTLYAVCLCGTCVRVCVCYGDNKRAVSTQPYLHCFIRPSFEKSMITRLFYFKAMFWKVC